ncbi:hypothetical protein QYF36_004078 [Acer negundo]|nr:hypothetical protein QYF36_004078 [Acer negundo]
MNLELTTKLEEVIKEKNDLKEEFEQRMKLKKEEILSTDKALKIMRTKEEKHLAKHAMTKIFMFATGCMKYWKILGPILSRALRAHRFLP